MIFLTPEVNVDEEESFLNMVHRTLEKRRGEREFVHFRREKRELVIRVRRW